MTVGQVNGWDQWETWSYETLFDGEPLTANGKP